MSLLLDTVVEHLQYKTTVSWLPCEITPEDIQHILQEAFDDSPFDPSFMRKTMITRYGEKEGVSCICKECKYGKVIVFYEDAQGDPTPWSFWGRVLSAIGPSTTSEPWRIVWFAAPLKREWPAPSTAVGSLHLNGGYAYPCKPRTIIIYRREEASRVLIHELLHAACTDDPGRPVEEREAYTEVWAEIFLIALLAKGSRSKARTLWKQQAQWMVAQHHRLRNDHNVHGPRDYAWRYTLGREEIYRAYGFQFPSTTPTTQTSLRFTTPALEPAKN